MERRTYHREITNRLYQIEYTKPYAKEIFAQQIYQKLNSIVAREEIVIICIGSDRSTGDSLGPLVGSHLQQVSKSNVHIFGDLDRPVHAINLADTIEIINTKHPQASVIAIDACLGRLNHIGQIQMGIGPIKPGAGVNKSLPEIGDLHIKGIVNVAGFMEYLVLQTTRLNMVIKMAEVISASLSIAVGQFHGHMYAKEAYSEQLEIGAD